MSSLGMAQARSGVTVQHQNLRESIYFAPRGKERLIRLGNYLAQRYLDPDDRLIGFIGSSGMGKSLLIRGMFPGLELKMCIRDRL